MLHLRTFGGVDARHEDGRDLAGLLAQPKRTALLVYLATATPRGFHRRDVLLSLFWPELDEERARAALRRALHFVRGAVGPTLLSARGDEVAVDPAGIATDVDALDAAGRADAPERVVALYGGDFLAGFHLRGAPGFAEWQDAERDRLRRRAVRARWTLADRAVAAGDGAAAAEHGARAAALDPFDEAGVRRHLALLRTLGDHAAALRAYAEFAARLRAEFDAAPAAETRRLAESLRAPATPPRAAPAVPPAPAPRDAAGDAPGGRPAVPPNTSSDRPPNGILEEPSGVLPNASPDELPSPPAAPGAPARARRPWRRRLPALLAAGAAIAGVLVVSTTGAVRLARPPAAAGRTTRADVRVAVLPFQVLGDARAAYLGPGMVDLLGASFDGAGALRPVDRYLLAGADAAPATTEPAAGLAAARRVGADRFVLGSVVDVGGQVRLRATLYDAAGAARATATAAGPEARVMAMVDDLARQLLRGEYAGRETRLTDVAIRTTASLPALKAYLHGVRHLRDGRFSEAADSFRVAVAADSEFALAYYHLSMAVGWQSAGRDHLASEYAAQAVRHARALGPHDDAILRAHEDAWHGTPAVAERRYEQILAAYPDDIEAWHELGELRFHNAPTRGRPPADARAPFEHALGAPALRPSALLHLARIAALEEDGARLDTLHALLRASAPSAATPPDARAREVGTLAAFAGAGATAARRDSVVADLAARDADAVWTQGWSVAMYAADWAGSERIFALLTDPARAPGDRALGWLAVAQVRAAAGRPAAAREAVGRAATLAPAWAAASGALLDALPFLGAGGAQRARARAAVRRWDGGLPDLGSSIAVQPRPGAPYRAGVLDALAGPTSNDRSLGAGPAPGPVPGLVSGRAGPLFPLSGHDRLAYADALLRAGRAAEAAGWAGAFPDPDVHDVVFYAPAALARARAAEAAGDRETAARARRRARRLWRDAEPAVRAALDSARSPNA